MIKMIRTDPLQNVATDSHEPGILSTHTFRNWNEVFVYLKSHGIPITDSDLAEMERFDDTQFSHREFVNAGHSAYSCNVLYDICVQS